MLATRGAIYRGEDTAERGSHANDRCGVAVESRYDAREDIAIDPADANRIITYRHQRYGAYEYDLSQYRVMGVTEAPVPPQDVSALPEPPVAEPPRPAAAGAGGGGDEPPGIGGGPPATTPGDDDYARSLVAGSDHPPFAPRTRPRLSRGGLNHILDRHHRPGRWPSKDKFPVHWTDSDVAAAVDAVLAAPDTVERFGDIYRFIGVVHGVLIRVNVRVDKPRPFIWNAYPVNRDGGAT